MHAHLLGVKEVLECFGGLALALQRHRRHRADGVDVAGGAVVVAARARSARARGAAGVRARCIAAARGPRRGYVIVVIATAAACTTVATMSQQM